LATLEERAFRGYLMIARDKALYSSWLADSYIDAGEIEAGQNVWQSLGGMEVGSVWGHGSYVAPDWTADWLHREATFILDRLAHEGFEKKFNDLNAEQQAAEVPIRVTVGELEEAGGETRIAQSFVLPHPRAAVWALMSDMEAVARCMPGLALDGPPVGDTLSGRLEAKIGPIAASFAGEGTLRQLPAEFRQVIEGRGGDRRSGSRASGSVDYRLSALTDDAGREATRVDVVIGYALTGPLAQIGRSGLVRDLVRRIGEAFAQNLDAQLHDPTSAMPQAKLGGLSLLLQILGDRVRALLYRIVGRR
jgi:carbon monoxide dehydrogenase subunit G